MREDRHDKSEWVSFVREWVERWERKGFRRYVIDGFHYLFPPLVNRPRCFTYNPKDYIMMI